MGYLRGKVEGDTFWIMDAYPLPVEGTETRVNAGHEALEYTGKFEDLNEVRIFALCFRSLRKRRMWSVGTTLTRIMGRGCQELMSALRK